jgi:CBS domain-containing protein|tara:strand:+ start:59 stop:529 length:471 start_codon:yes stop_codon:yes gene_type:complete
VINLASIQLYKEPLMMKIYEILAAKGNQVWSIASDQLVYTAIEMMAEKEVGALIVTEQDALAGIISERDYTRKVILKGKSSREILVKEIMTEKVVVAHDQLKVDECLAMVSEFKVRHLPVMDGDRVIGMVSMGDLVKSIIDEQKFVIDQLEQYIRG